MAEDRKDVPYKAEWTANLQHRTDPNRVSSTPASIHQTAPEQREAELTPPAETLHLGREPMTSLARAYDPQSNMSSPGETSLDRGQSGSEDPSYYDVPMLKQPVWKWEIAWYFFLGGLSAGAYVLGRTADRAGRGRHRNLARVSSYLAMAALIPCPPLLINDLGDPKRFHHMLRVWKPSTPMNLGTWSIVAYSGMAAYEVLRQYLTEKDRHLSPGQHDKLLKVMNNGMLLAVHDAVGVPFALIVAGYTGVLLSCTANPLWCKNPWLGPLFSASAIATGAEAISLALDLSTRQAGADRGSQEVLQHVDTAAHAAELACMEGFRRYAGERGKPLYEGKYHKHHLISLGGIITAEVLKRLPVDDRYRKPVRIVASAMGLVAGFSLRWSMVFAGHAAAADPRTARLVSQPRTQAKRIGAKARESGPAHATDPRPDLSAGNGRTRRR